MNKAFAKLDAGGIVYAPSAVKLDARIYLHPTAEQYAVVGYLPVVDEAPAGVPQGKHAEAGAWEEADGAIRRVYAVVDDPPPPPRTFSKLKCVAALAEAGVWPEVKAWLDSAGLYDLYLAAQDFAEDNEYFVQGLSALKPALGWTDGQVEALLAQCVAGGGRTGTEGDGAAR